jgi:hypothetical protein
MDWDEAAETIGRARTHFERALLIRDRLADDEPGSLEAYIHDMALRHALSCGEAEIAAFILFLRSADPKGRGYSHLSPETRKAYLAARGHAYEEYASAGEVEPETLRAAIDVAAVLAEALPADFERIRREMADA